MKLFPSLIVLAISAAALPAVADEPASDSLSFNVGAVSDYRFRGISQTRFKPALQGGIDYAAANGFYIGTWASTIKWIKDAGGDAPLEIDLYGGYTTELASGVTLDVGLLQYGYPSNKLSPSTNTLEIYGAVSFGPVTAKYSHSTTNLFGYADSKGSGYFDLSATFDLGDGLSLTPHIGHQTVKRNSSASYTDYSVTLAKEVSGVEVSAALIGTNADKGAYASPVNGKFTGKTMFVVGLKKSF